MIKKKTIKGISRHYIVGIIVERNEKYLLLERINFPYGFACPAGHVDEGETIGEAMNRELKEETGLIITDSKKVYSDIISINPCRYDGTYNHVTYIYKVKTKGIIKIDKNEFKSYDWYSEEEILTLNLEPMWKFVFGRIIKNNN